MFAVQYFSFFFFLFFCLFCCFFFFFQAEDGIRDVAVTGVQTCALPICVLETIEKYVGPEYCKDAETAIVDVDGDFLEYKGENVQWHQTPDDVAETMAYILTLPKKGEEIGRASCRERV